MRVIHENDPGHPDNHGYVVSHIGLNNDSNWRDFRDVDFEDQEIFRRWVCADPMEESEDGEGQPRRFDMGMQVKDEIISHFIGSAFLNPDDDRVLDEILAQKVPGTPFKLSDLTSREDLRTRLKLAQQEHEQKPEAIPVSPQRRRRTTRIRLSERTNSAVARILKDLHLSLPGREVGRVMPRMGTLNNRTAVTQLLNREINGFLNITSGQRNALTAAQTESAFSELDILADKVRDSISAKLGGEHA
jgi:hypothetical protein